MTDPKVQHVYDEACAALIGEAVEMKSAVRDAERLDFMAAEECQIESLTLASGTRHRVRWTSLDEAQVDWFKTPREAIDAAILALHSTSKEPAK